MCKFSTTIPRSFDGTFKCLVDELATTDMQENLDDDVHGSFLLSIKQYCLQPGRKHSPIGT